MCESGKEVGKMCGSGGEVSQERCVSQVTGVGQVKAGRFECDTESVCVLLWYRLRKSGRYIWQCSSAPTCL
jgi:hypothetical protein